MIDNLRESIGSGPFFNDDEPQEAPQPVKHQQEEAPQRILGMTAPQRFILALMLFLMACALGSLLLVVTEKVVLPF